MSNWKAWLFVGFGVFAFLPQPVFGESIKLRRQGGVHTLPVLMNGSVRVYFVLDTGAAETNIPSEVLLTLFHTGTITNMDFLEGKTYRLADGSVVKSERFLIRSLTIGSITITNVAASIAPTGGPLLLGQNCLKHLGPYTIDSAAGTLTFKEKLVVQELPSVTPVENIQSAEKSPARVTSNPGQVPGSVQPPRLVYVDRATVGDKYDLGSFDHWIKLYNAGVDHFGAANFVDAASSFDLAVQQVDRLNERFWAKDTENIIKAYSVSYGSRGFARFHAQNYEGALLDLNKAIKSTPTNPDFYEMRSRVWDAKGEPQKAQNDLNWATRLRKTSD